MSALKYSIMVAAGLWLAACGDSGDDRQAGVAPEPAEPSAPAADEEYPERDVSGIDVCAAVPAQTLAAALAMSVETAERLEHDPAPNCSYHLIDADGRSQRIDVMLQDGFDYDWALQTARNFEREIVEIHDLGGPAFTKKTIDGWSDVWARRPDGLVVNTMAHEQALAIEAARLALQIP